MSQHRYNRSDLRSGAAAPSPSSSSAPPPTMGPLGVDWGTGPSGGDLSMDPMAMLVGGGGYTINSNTANVNVSELFGGFSGLTTPATTVTTTTMSSTGGGHGYGNGNSSGGRQRTPPELKGANLAGFLLANNLSSGGGSAGGLSSPPVSGNSHASSMMGASGLGVNPIASAHNGIRRDEFRRPSAAAAAHASVPAPLGGEGFPAAPHPQQQHSGSGVFRASPPPPHHPISGPQHFSGNNILSSLAAATSGGRQGTSPSTLHTPPSITTATSGIMNPPPHSGSSDSANNNNAAGRSIMSFFQNGAAAAGTPSTAAAPPAAGAAAAPPAAAAGNGSVASMFSAAIGNNKNAATGSVASSAHQTPSSVQQQQQQRASGAPPPAVGATPPTSGPASKLTSPTANKSNGGAHNTNNNKNDKFDKSNNNNTATAHHHNSNSNVPAPLQSRVIALPPQHEVFVLFPNAEAVKAHYRAYGANYNVVAPSSYHDATTTAAGSDNGTPGSPSRTAAATAATQVVSGASVHANFDPVGIGRLFNNGNAVSANANSGLTTAAMNAGYRVSKPTRTNLRPRVTLFGQFDTIPMAQCFPAAEGVGLLFCNDGVDEAIASLNTDGFVDINSAAGGLQSTSSQSDFGGSVNGGGNGAQQVSVIAELIIYNAVSISAPRPIDPRAKNIHDYLSQLRSDAIEGQTRGPNVMIVGNTDTGKSSLANYLVNAHLKESFASFLRFKEATFNARRKVKEQLEADGLPATPAAIAANAAPVAPPFSPQIQLVDLDIGQQGASLPGCVSATNYLMVNKSRLQSGQSVFYGDTTIQSERDRKSYLHCVDALLKTTDNNMSIDRWETDRKRMFHYPIAIGRIINTMGYTVDAGFDALVDLVGICKVDTIIVTGNNSDLQFRLQDAIRKRYGPSSSASSVSALSGLNAHVAKHYCEPTFMLYCAPDCPVTPHGQRKAKRDAKIVDYLKSMRFGDVFNTNNNNGSGDTPSSTASFSNNPVASSTPGSPHNTFTNSFARGTPPTVNNMSSAFPLAANTTLPLNAPNPNRQLVHRVPLSRLDIRDAKTFIPITGQAFLKMGTKKLAAIPLPTYNEVGNAALASLGNKCFFPMLEPAVPDESKLSSNNNSGTASKNPTAPTSPTGPHHGASLGAAVPNPNKTEIDHLLLPNARGVIAFAGMMGLVGNEVELIFDPLYVEEKLAQANVLKGGAFTKRKVPPSEEAAKDLVKAFLAAGDYTKERITLLLSNIPLPEESLQVVIA